jgi:hypothetical protein
MSEASPLTDIADNIIPWLRPLKPGDLNTHVAKMVNLRINMIREGEAHFAQFERPAIIREKAAAAFAALTALEKALPCPTDIVGRTREWIEPLQDVAGPDPRTNTLHWQCALHAFLLVREFSEKKAVTTQGGNVHSIAILLHEAIAGTQSPDAGLLRSVRKVTRWYAGNDPADGLQWIVRTKFR